jgi:hypothetical protein
MRSTLRVLWMRPSRDGGEWKLIYPFSEGPLSVYDCETLAMQVAEELLGREEGGSLALLGADGHVLHEEWVPPLAAEDTHPDDCMGDNSQGVSVQLGGETFAVEVELSRRSPDE